MNNVDILSQSHRDSTNDVRHSKPRPTLHCRVLPPGEINGTIPVTLLSIYPERLIAVTRTVAMVTNIITNINITTIFVITYATQTPHRLPPGHVKQGGGWSISGEDVPPSGSTLDILLNPTNNSTCITEQQYLKLRYI